MTAQFIPASLLLEEAQPCPTCFQAHSVHDVSDSTQQVFDWLEQAETEEQEVLVAQRTHKERQAMLTELRQIGGSFAQTACLENLLKNTQRTDPDQVINVINLWLQEKDIFAQVATKWLSLNSTILS